MFGPNCLFKLSNGRVLRQALDLEVDNSGFLLLIVAGEEVVAENVGGELPDLGGLRGFSRDLDGLSAAEALGRWLGGLGAVVVGVERGSEVAELLLLRTEVRVVFSDLSFSELST